MAADDLAPEIRRFIVEHITSVAQLEMLLLMRTNPDEAWSAGQLARELRVEPSWAESQLDAFHVRGLLERAADRSTYRLAPRSPGLEQALTALSRAYLLQRVRIIELIYSTPTDRIRTFADAFRLKKEPPDG